MERAIAYVQMNPVAANVCMEPGQYPWGTGGVFFNASFRNDCRPLGEMSARERYRLMHTKAELPSGWLVCPQGYVIPESYVDVEFVERVFRKPKRMTFFLMTSSKARQRFEKGVTGLPAFQDQVIMAALPDLCRSMFGKGTVAELGEKELVEILRQLKFRFSASIGQIARVTGLSLEQTVKILDGV